MRARVVIVSFAGVALLVACGGVSSVDAHRLHVLSSDPLAVARAPGTTPWIPAVDTPEHIEANGSAGRGDGIGFGGTSPTLVQVTRHLQAKPADVLRFYAETAIRNGWRIGQIHCRAHSDSFAASKQFDDFTASAVVGTGAVFNHRPAMSLNIETDWHGYDVKPAHPRVQPKVDVHWLTVGDLSSTCIGEANPFTRALRAFGVDIDAAPPAAVQLDTAVFCGAEQDGGTIDAEGRQCFLDRRASGLAAVFVVEQSTVEGDPVVTIYRADDEGRIRLYIDATRDKFGSGEWERQACSGITIALQSPPEPRSESHFEATGCQPV